MFKPLPQRRVIRFPDDSADRERAKVHFAVLQLDLDAVAGDRLQLIDAPALLVLLGVAFVEHDAIAGFEVGL